MSQATPRAADPYVGLRAFELGDRDRFFGRTAQAHELYALWLCYRLVILYGPSGVGKSSLIRAGVPPDGDPEADVLPVGRAAPSRVSSVPAAPSSAGNPYVFALLSSWFPSEAPIRLAGISIIQGLRRRPQRVDRHSEPLPVLAAIDQFEEVLTDPEPWAAYRRDFLAQLRDALKEFPALRLLIAMREESLPAMLPHETELAGHSRARLRLRPLEPEAALEAVTRPIAGTGRSYAPGAAERLVGDLRTAELTGPLGERVSVVDPAVEPWQLQVACSELWRSLPEDVDSITVDWVRRTGRVDQVLSDYLERTVDEVAEARDLPATAVWRWLTGEFITELGTRGLVHEGFSETGGLPNGVAQDLEAARILRSERRRGARWYELSHDRLAELLGPLSARRAADGATPGPAEYLAAARGAYAEGEIDLATEHAAGALRTATDEQARIRAEAEVLIADVVAQRGQTDEAVRRYERAAALFEVLAATGAVARCLAAIGRLLMERGEHALAIARLHGALTRQPGDPDVRAELAAAHWRSGQPGPAAAIFTSILNVHPDHPEAMAGHAQIQADRGDHADALIELDLLRDRHPEVAARPEVRAARAVALAGAGRLTEAWDEVAAAVMAEPPAGAVLWRAAVVAVAAEDETLAIRYLRRALDAPDPLFAHMFAEARDMLQRLA